MKKVFFLIVSALIFGLVFTGCSDIANITGPATVNTDGNLYKCQTCVQGDTATGMGEKIKEKGKWFMYNVYPDDFFGVDRWDVDIQAGNPKDGKNINMIGYYSIEENADGSYTAEYYIDPSFVVVEEHLAIQDDYHDFTAAPGKDDNANFYEPFDDPDENNDGKFYVFAHFAVECR